MDVAILYSGGKDSTFAIQHANEKGWNIKYLISVKPAHNIVRLCTICIYYHFFPPNDYFNIDLQILIFKPF